MRGRAMFTVMKYRAEVLFQRGLVLAILSSCLVSVWAQASSDNPRSNIDSTIEYAISLLENHEYATFIQKIFSPQQLKAMLKKQGINEVVENFTYSKSGRLSKADRLLKQLKYIQARHPKIDGVAPSSSTLNFAYDQPPGHVDIITFWKDEEHWWLKN